VAQARLQTADQPRGVCRPLRPFPDAGYRFRLFHESSLPQGFSRVPQAGTTRVNGFGEDLFRAAILDERHQLVDLLRANGPIPSGQERGLVEHLRGTLLCRRPVRGPLLFGNESDWFVQGASRSDRIGQPLLQHVDGIIHRQAVRELEADYCCFINGRTHMRSILRLDHVNG